MVSFLGDHCFTAIIISTRSLTRWLWTLRYDVIDSALPNSAGEQLKMCLLVKTSLGRIRRFSNVVPFQELIWELMVNWTDFADMSWFFGSVNIKPLKWIVCEFVCCACVPTNMKYHNNMCEQVASRPVPSCWTVQLSPSIVHSPTFYHFFSAFDVTLFALSNFSLFLGYNWQQ